MARLEMNENTEPRVQIIENATPDEGRAGDHLIRESIRTEDGVTLTVRREGVAHHRDRFGNWRTVELGWLTDGQGEGTTLTIRRTVRDLPTEPGIVIVTNDECGAIEAESGGSTWRANEAILGANGRWYGVWRRASGLDSQTDPVMLPKDITPGTWKVEEGIDRG